MKLVKALFSNRLELDDGQSLQREARPCLSSPEKIARQVLTISGLTAKFHDLERTLLVSADSVPEIGQTTEPFSSLVDRQPRGSAGWF